MQVTVTIPKPGNKWKVMSDKLVKTYDTRAATKRAILACFRGQRSGVKSSLVVKGYIDSHLRILNESLSSSSRGYLKLVTSCFLE